MFIQYKEYILSIFITDIMSYVQAKKYSLEPKICRFLQIKALLEIFYQSFQGNKNNRLAKENNALKAMISQKDQAQEDILKKTVKAEYSQILSYKEMLKTIESSIQALEQSVAECKKIQETVLKNRRILSDSTNLLQNESFRMKDNSFNDSLRLQLKPKDRRKKEIIEENDIVQINDTGKTKGSRKRTKKRIEENLFNK